MFNKLVLCCWTIMVIMIGSLIFTIVTKNRKIESLQDKITIKDLSYANAIAKEQLRVKEIESKYSKLNEEKYETLKIEFGEVQRDIVDATNNSNSLYKKINQNINTLHNAPKETIINYTITSNDLFKECVGEYQKLGAEADNRIYDIKRLEGYIDTIQEMVDEINKNRPK